MEIPWGPGEKHSTGIPVQPNTTFNIFVEATATFAVNSDSRTIDSHFGLTSEDGAKLDFFSTAHLTFDLPQGVRVSSVGGFFQGATVPEPSAQTLLGLGMLALSPHRCRRRAKHENEANVRDRAGTCFAFRRKLTLRFLFAQENGSQPG
jgi:hypothetical protein